LLARCEEENPREEKLKRGSSRTRPKPLRAATDSHPEQSPEGGRVNLEPIGKLFGREGRQRQEGNGRRRACAAGCEGKTLRSEPWTWLRGETNPRRQAEEETVEDVRNVEDGT
jgi:hypothetical protein